MVRGEPVVTAGHPPAAVAWLAVVVGLPVLLLVLDALTVRSPMVFGVLQIADATDFAWAALPGLAGGILGDRMLRRWPGRVSVFLPLVVLGWTIAGTIGATFVLVVVAPGWTGMLYFIVLAHVLVPVILWQAVAVAVHGGIQWSRRSAYPDRHRGAGKIRDDGSPATQRAKVATIAVWIAAVLWILVPLVTVCDRPAWAAPIVFLPAAAMVVAGATWAIDPSMNERLRPWKVASGTALPVLVANAIVLGARGFHITYAGNWFYQVFRDQETLAVVLSMAVQLATGMLLVRPRLQERWRLAAVPPRVILGAAVVYFTSLPLALCFG